jgi:hypothetical protein
MASAQDLNLIQQMEELLTCSICKGTLNEPTTLSCFHSYCKQCISRYIEIQREEAQQEHRAQHLFNCPQCRTQFELKQGESVEHLPSNYFINNMLGILKIQQQAHKLSCESCRAQLPAACRCIDCERYLCKNCLTTHNNWHDFNDHVVLTLEELAKPGNQAKSKEKLHCQKHGHEKKAYAFYCDTCQELICINCAVLDHPKPDHSCQPLNKVADEYKKSLKTTSHMLQEKSNESQNTLKKIKDAAQFLEGSTKKAREAILKQNEEILNEFAWQLGIKTRVLFEEVDENYRLVNEILDKQTNYMKAYVEKVNGSLDLAKNLVETGSNEEILSLGKKIEVNANDIEKECPKLMQPAHNGNIEYRANLIKPIVDRINLNDLGNVGR